MAKSKGRAKSVKKTPKKGSSVSVDKRNALIFIVVFAFIGAVLLLVVNAASPAAPVEPEDATVISPATECSDSNASGGGCVQFKAAGAILPAGAAANIKSWALNYSDEFNDTTVDSSVWSKGWFTIGPEGYSLPINSQETGCYHTGQVSEYGGSLHLVTAPTSDPKCLTRNGAGTVKSGIVASNGKKTFRYGYFEARVYMPGNYNWPAWWTNGDHDDHPDHGELDIWELLSCRIPAWHIHYSGAGPVEAGTCVNGRTSVGWHTYGMNWTSSRADFYYDGELVGGANVSIPYDHYLVLNHGVKSSYTNGTVEGVDMQVDYVRVWK